MTLSVPAGAVTGQTVLTAEPTDEVPPGTGAIEGTVFDFGPDGTEFAEPISITVPYLVQNVPEGVREESLGLFVLVDGFWEALDGTVDTTAKTITGFTDHFSTFGILTLVRFCPGSPGPTSFETFQAAFDATLPGGTIEVCQGDGPHSIEGAVISAPVTIRPELGASPMIETSVATTTFLLDGYTSGTVLIDGLIFNLLTPTADQTELATVSYVIRGLGTYDQLIVRNSTFNIDPLSSGSVLFWNNTVTGSGALVENTTFNGGDFGVAIFEAGLDVQLNVRQSHFFGAKDLALLWTEASGGVENSTFTDCFGDRCIVAFRGSRVDVISNVFTDCFGIQCVLASQGADVDVISNVFAAPDFTGGGGSPVRQTVGYFSGASGLVDDNDFDGCGFSRCVNVEGEGTQVDITNNRFQVDPSDAVNVNPSHSVIRYQFDALATLENNQFTGCFRFCILVRSGADVALRGNDINISAAHTTASAILGFGDDGGPLPSLTIEDNTITADMTGVVLSDPSTFRITDASIEIDRAIATIHRNRIEGAARGIIASDDGQITAGEDNVIDQSNTGVMIIGDAVVNLNFNDITSFVPINDQTIASDLRCNWWGDPAGPASTADFQDAGTFTPWATAPIAATDHSGCLDRWTTLAPMPTARVTMSAGVIDDKLYVVGGVNAALGELSSLEAYDPVTDTWTTKTSMPTARRRTSAGVIDGKLYVVGGVGKTEVGENQVDLGTLEVYDPITDTWATLAPMPTPRVTASAGVIDGKLYVVGGIGADPGDLTTLEVYDPVTGTWTTKTPMPVGRRRASAGVINGKLYVVGGSDVPPNFDPNHTMVAYDPVTDTWTTETPMPTGRHFASAGVIDDKLYVVGGFQADYISALEVYDPVADIWTTEIPMPTARSRASAGVIDGKLYVVGGTKGDPFPNSDLGLLQVYTP